MLPDATAQEQNSIEFGTILASEVTPTALFAGNDTLAIGAMMAVREAGLAIPDDFAVVGYDDIPGAAFANPPLTTIASHQNYGGQKRPTARRDSHRSRTIESLDPPGSQDC